MPRKGHAVGRPSETELSRRGGTGDLLIAAATIEFNAEGFDGTDSNRIARRAGFAPQTFYRWFEDKTAIFIEVYERWRAEEEALLRDLLGRKASDRALAHAVVAHHRASLVFRRSLRRLSLEEGRVRAARAASRLQQIAFIAGPHARRASAVAATLLQVERLADALAEAEFADMGLEPTAAEEALAGLIQDLRTRRAPRS